MRKLACVSAAFSAAVFAANYILPVGILLPAALLLVLIGIGLASLKAKFLRAAILALIGAALGFVFFTGNWALTSLRAEKAAGQELELSCLLTDYPIAYDDYCRAEVRIDSGKLMGLKAVVYDSSMALSSAEPGQRIRFRGSVRAADTRYGEDYDYYNSVGIYLIVTAKGSIYGEVDSPSPLSFPVRLRSFVASRIDEVFPGDTAAFMRSLMLGDKTELYKQADVHRSMSHAGLMHIVAVSGMHIAFMIAMVQNLFGCGKTSSLLSLVFIWLFVLVTGMSPSAVRAGIMQSFVLMAPVLGRENDPATSLSAALALILAANPYAATSVSLQLSFAATAGILLLAPVFAKKLSSFAKGKPGKISLYLIKTLATSAAGMIFTTPLVAVHFGYISVYSILSNVLALPAVSACFTMGYVSTALSFLPVGAWLGWATAWLARYIMAVAKIVSYIPFSAVYLENIWTKLWLILSCALFILAYFAGKTFMRRVLLPAALSFAMLMSVSTAMYLVNTFGKAVVCAVDVGQGQCIVMYAGTDTVMVDCGGESSLDKAGEEAYAYLKSSGRRRVDVLILTHLHSDHANGVEYLLGCVDVGMIIMPHNPEDPEGLLPGILDAAKRQGTRLAYINDDTLLKLDRIKAELYAPPLLGSTNERCLMAKLSVDEFDMLVTGDSDSKAEKALTAEHDLSGTELLIVGHHGSRYSSCGELLSELDGENAIISVGYNNYGHPTYETLERLTAYGYNIYRTDINGNIQIRVG